jgi:hypothetical protein
MPDTVADFRVKLNNPHQAVGLKRAVWFQDFQELQNTIRAKAVLEIIANTASC